MKLPNKPPPVSDVPYGSLGSGRFKKNKKPCSFHKEGTQMHGANLPFLLAEGVAAKPAFEHLGFISWLELCSLSLLPSRP